MKNKKENQINNEGFNNPNSRLTLEERKTIFKLREEGLSYRDISYRVKCSHTQVKRVLEPQPPRYVYEIVNTITNVVEHVGESSNPQKRFDQHKRKVVNSNGDKGLFYGREEIHLVVHPTPYPNQIESIEAQRQLQIKYGLPTDNEKWSKTKDQRKVHKKLTDEEVLQIREIKSENPQITNVQLANQFGVDFRMIGNIVNRKTRIKI